MTAKEIFEIILAVVTLGGVVWSLIKAFAAHKTANALESNHLEHMKQEVADLKARLDRQDQCNQDIRDRLTKIETMMDGFIKVCDERHPK